MLIKSFNGEIRYHTLTASAPNVLNRQAIVTPSLLQSKKMIGVEAQVTQAGK